MRKSYPQILIAFIFATSFLAAELFAQSSEEAMVQHGRQVYLKQCARCHGNDAKGGGIDAKRLPVVPRNLVEEEYKFKSTEYGTPPSDADLFWILEHGMAGTGMPSFANLAESDQKGLVAYIKSISNQWGDYPPEQIAPPNEKLKVNLAKGKEVFDLLQCALCHGDGGRANGTSAAGLAVKPANLTQPWRYKAGQTPRDIYFRLMAGIAGSGMPSYKDAIPAEDAWQLANYVASLQINTHWESSVRSFPLKGKGPVTADDKIWNSAQTTHVVMQGDYYKNGQKQYMTVNSVGVQSIHNEDSIHFRFTWDDPTQSLSRPPDGLQMAYRPTQLEDDARDNLHTLYLPKSDILDVSQWKADKKEFVFQKNSTLLETTGLFWKPDNKYPAEAQYEDGHWVLVFSQPLTERIREAMNSDAVELFFGLAAWDGDNQEDKLKRSASRWIQLAFHSRKVH